MDEFAVFDSPLGPLTIQMKAGALCGLWMENQKNFPNEAIAAARSAPLPPARGVVAQWLTDYFAGSRPGLSFPVRPAGTYFQLAVWSALLDIPYGEIATYSAVAQIVGERRGAPSAARAIGGAVAKNALMIVVPCHRVVGASGSLTGYAGGIGRKSWLLQHEKATASYFPSTTAWRRPSQSREASPNSA